MKGFFHKLAFLGERDRRDLTALLLSFLVALSIWFIHNLSLKYTDFVTVTVTARSSIDGHSEMSSNSSEVVARARCIGYNILSMNLGRSRPRVVSFDADDFHHGEGDSYYITSKELAGYSHELFGDGSVVEYFVSDTVWFKFGAVSHKRVPVIVNGSFVPREHYKLVGGVKIEPDSVTVYGDQAGLATIDGIMTSRIGKTGIDKDGSGVLKLSRLRNFRLSDDAVKYSYVASRYVDISSVMSLQVRNKPADKDIMVVPSSVSVKFSCKFPYADDPTAKAVFFVDYDDYVNSLSGKCPVKVSGLDSDVIEFTVDPEYVEVIAR